MKSYKKRSKSKITRSPHFLLSKLMYCCFLPASFSIHLLLAMSPPATSPISIAHSATSHVLTSQHPPLQHLLFRCLLQCHPSATSHFLTSSLANPLCDVSFFDVATLTLLNVFIFEPSLMSHFLMLQCPPVLIFDIVLRSTPLQHLIF